MLNIPPSADGLGGRYIKNKHMKKLRYIILLTAVLSLPLSAQTNPALQVEVKQTGGWVFYAPETPRIEIGVKNPGNEKVNQNIRLTVSTDKRMPVYCFAQQTTVAPHDTAQVNFSFTLPAPGFYRCTVSNEDIEIQKFNIGYEPEAIVSLPDNQPDIDTFWETAKKELAAVAPDYKMTLLPGLTTDKRRLYQVSMKSLGNVEIAGYYCVPVKKGKYPVIISYMGYGSKPWQPKPNDNPGYAEFVLSTRGQGLNEKANSYGDWITYELGNKDKYYYRGAFMDLIRAIDFVSSRPETDTLHIFAEGGSQGGAFTLAACALDQRIAAAAPTIPFLSDYPDYFSIVHWPAEPVLKKQAELGLTDDQLYETLSYFDIKNLAQKITCPIMMGVGLQDEVCPPHTNFAGYNRISAEKKYYIFTTYGHDVPAEWWQLRHAFFEKQRKINRFTK